MKTLKVLPRRVFNSPLIEYANFNGNRHINLIRLIKPYADGTKYVVTNTVNEIHTAHSNYYSAKEQFEFRVWQANKTALPIGSGITGNK